MSTSISPNLISSNLISPALLVRLDGWLLNNPKKFERYIERHPDVIAFFEARNPFDNPGAAKALRSAVATVPLEFVERMRERMSAGANDTGAFASAIDLGGIGLAALMLLANVDRGAAK